MSLYSLEWIQVKTIKEVDLYDIAKRDDEYPGTYIFFKISSIMMAFPFSASKPELTRLAVADSINKVAEYIIDESTESLMARIEQAGGRVVYDERSRN